MAIITINTDDIMSVGDAARILDRPPVTIYRWIADGKLPAVKFSGVLYVPRADIERLKGEHDNAGNRRD